MIGVIAESTMICGVRAVRNRCRRVSSSVSGMNVRGPGVRGRMM